MADRLDEQLHETCGGVFSHSISLSAMARGLPLVPGETCMQTGTEWTGIFKNNIQHQPEYSLITEHLCGLLGHPGGCRCCHRCYDVAEWGHEWPGSLELRNAPC